MPITQERIFEIIEAAEQHQLALQDCHALARDALLQARQGNELTAAALQSILADIAATSVPLEAVRILERERLHFRKVGARNYRKKMFLREKRGDKSVLEPGQSHLGRAIRGKAMWAEVHAEQARHATQPQVQVQPQGSVTIPAPVASTAAHDLGDRTIVIDKTGTAQPQDFTPDNLFQGGPDAIARAAIDAEIEAGEPHDESE